MGTENYGDRRDIPQFWAGNCESVRAGGAVHGPGGVGNRKTLNHGEHRGAQGKHRVPRLRRTARLTRLLPRSG